MEQNQKNNHELLKLYESGISFLEGHPNLKELHHKLGALSVAVATRFEPMILKKWKEKDKEHGADGIREQIATFYFLTGIGVFFCFWLFVVGLFTGQIFQSIVLGLIIFIAYGSVAVYSAANPVSDFRESPLIAEQIKVHRVEIVDPVSATEGKKMSPTKRDKNTFSKIYGGIQSLIFIGWLYAIVYHPDAIYQVFSDWHLLQFIPADIQTQFQSAVEEGKNHPEMLCIFGFISGLFINFILSAIEAIITLLYSFLHRLSSKKDIREI